MTNDSRSFRLAKKFMGQVVTVTVDRPLGSKHPKWGFEYPVNYGFLKGIIAPDGEELDAYVLKIKEPIKEFTGVIVAIVHRTEDDDDKLVVTPQNITITNEEIEAQIEFQEKFFKHVITR